MSRPSSRASSRRRASVRPRARTRCRMHSPASCSLTRRRTADLRITRASGTGSGTASTSAITPESDGPRRHLRCVASPLNSCRRRTGSTVLRTWTILVFLRGSESHRWSSRSVRPTSWLRSVSSEPPTNSACSRIRIRPGWNGTGGPTRTSDRRSPTSRGTWTTSSRSMRTTCQPRWRGSWRMPRSDSAWSSSRTTASGDHR